MSAESEREQEDREIASLLESVYSRYHYDFRSYAKASVKRRLSAALSALHSETLPELERRILSDGATFTQVLRFLTVQTSEMFRDPGFFRTMRRSVVPWLATYPSLKVWVAGCSTGEELYSLAILLREEGLLDRTLLYATDIDPEVLRRAEAGIFDISRIPLFTQNHRASGGKGSLSDYYTTGYGSAVFDRTLRKNVVFSDHSLATDSVFAEVHVVSCRNVLIYFDRTLQDRALGLMEEALIRRGFLGLGAKESVRFSEHGAAFEEIPGGEKWYRKC